MWNPRINKRSQSLQIYNEFMYIRLPHSGSASRFRRDRFWRYRNRAPCRARLSRDRFCAELPLKEIIGKVIIIALLFGVHSPLSKAYPIFFNWSAACSELLADEFCIVQFLRGRDLISKLLKFILIGWTSAPPDTYGIRMALQKSFIYTQLLLAFCFDLWW